MNTNSPNWVQIACLVLVALLCVGGVVLYTGVNDAKNSASDANAKVSTVATSVSNLDTKVNNVANSIPTASEIASQVVIPTPPAQTVTGGSDETDVLQGVYSTEAHILQSNCISGLQNEFSNTKVLDKIQELIESSSGESIHNLVITDWNYQNQYHFTATNLGLDNFADRTAKITDTIRVSYKNEDGNQDTLRDKVYATAICSDWNIRTDRFRSLTVDFSL